MRPTLAQVLNTLAHELRTPIAVSQGYVKLWLDGRLGSPEEQRRAMQQTYDAMGRLVGLCAEAGQLATVSEAGDPPLPQRVPLSRLLDELRTAPQLQGVPWSGACHSSMAVATWSLPELASAVAVLIRTVVDEARNRPTAIEIGPVAHSVFSLRAGAVADLDRIADGPGGARGAPFDVVRGGKGLSVIWATFILADHNVQTWQLADQRSAVGFRIPLIDL